MSVKPSLTVLVAAVCLLSGCDKSPSAPNPPGPPPGPSLVCPPAMSVRSESGGPHAVSYPLPVPSTANPPVSVACTPGPGAVLPIGSHPVVCTAVDAVGNASCTFRIEVTRPQAALKHTRFLAFGDSQTEGFLRDPPDFETAFRPLFVSPTQNYPYYLQEMLRLRYGRDDIVVINEGLGGETVIEAQDRIIGTLLKTQPHVLLLLHGYNNLLTIPIEDARDAFRAIARTAQVRGVEVVLATLFQVGDAREMARPGTQKAISDLNDRLRSLAGQLNLGGVADLEQAFGGDQSLYGSDGFHPNAAGYRRVAETFRDQIIERFEETPVPLPVPAPAFSPLFNPQVGPLVVAR